MDFWRLSPKNEQKFGESAKGLFVDGEIENMVK